MTRVFFYCRRAVAVALGLCLTGYSAWASWSHFHDFLGPLAAVAAAAMLALAEHSWRDRQRLRALVLGILGLAAAVISGSVVLERVSHRQEARQHSARSDNLPRVEAQKALAEAGKALAAIEAAAKAGRGRRCRGLEEREGKARQRVEAARTKLTGLGAQTAENPAAAMLGLGRKRSSWPCCWACPCG
jgi:hypothetical protein